MFLNPFIKYSKKYKEMYDQLFKLQDLLAEENTDSIKAKELSYSVDKLMCEIDTFVEEEYAKKVFDVYRNKKPELVFVVDGRIVGWTDAFGEDFEKIPKTLRHSLIGLVEGSGRYRLKKKSL